jgi:hypothetical protein
VLVEVDLWRVTELTPCAGPPPSVEPMTGIEPAYSAWEADVLPLNYIGDAAWEG